MRDRKDNSAKKLRGGFYTPPAVADALARWVAGTPRPRPLRLLEPSCGDGALLRAVASLAIDVSLTAWDVDADAVTAARPTVHALDGTLHHGDYLAHSGEYPDDAVYDAVIGNPPYIRYQYLAPETRDAIARRLAAAGVPNTRHANAWLPFVVDAVDRLAPGGRVAMVLPAELLQVSYTAPLRRFLLEKLSRLELVTLAEPVFDGVLQEVLVLLGEAGTSPCQLRMHALQGAEELSREMPALAPLVAHPDETEKWSRYWLDDASLASWESCRKRAGVVPFTELARVEVGVVTGANRFFCVDRETVDTFELAPIARPLLGRSAQATGVVLRAADHDALVQSGQPVFLLHFPDAPVEDLPEPWQRYLALGEDQGLQHRYKCRVRKPWYRVPAVWASPVSLFKRCHAATRLMRNEAGCITTDTVYRVRPLGDPDALVTTFVNSLTFVSIELNARSYGGGVLELVPGEIRRLRLPRVTPEPGWLEELDRLWRAGTPTEHILTEADRRVLGPLGFSAEEQKALRRSWRVLCERRLRRAAASRATPS